MFTLKNFAIGFLLLLATALSAWSIIISRPLLNTAAKDPTQADSYMEDVVATTYNKEGGPSLKLVTPSMVHYPENNTTQFATPHLTLYRDSPEPWYLDAKHGKASNGTGEILFWDDVNIHHMADTSNPTTTLITDSLTIFPDKQVASTNKPVTFMQPDTTVHAIGMLANLKDNTVKLLSQARGEYAPH